MSVALDSAMLTSMSVPVTGFFGGWDMPAIVPGSGGDAYSAAGARPGLQFPGMSFSPNRLLCAPAKSNGSGNPASAPLPPSGPPSSPPGDPDDMAKIFQMVGTPGGEIALFDSAVNGGHLGLKWLDAVVKGLKGEGEFVRLARRPLVGALAVMAERPLIPESDNFTPIERTPWAGRRISKMKASLGVDPNERIGESWEISGHPSFPNKFPLEYAGRDLSVPLGILETLIPAKLFGPQIVSRFGGRMPFLAKLLSSAENLSIQVHPREGYKGLKEGEHSKTEAWYIIDAEEGAGIYIGMRRGVTEKKMRKDLEAGRDISPYLNFVEVEPGEVYFIPAGTPHAIGKGVFLYEPQETSETTYRYYDWGRVDRRGGLRPLHIEDALAVTDWDAPRGEAFIEQVRRMPTVVNPGSEGSAREESLISVAPFALNRLTFEEACHSYFGNAISGMEGLTIIEGSVLLYGGTERIAELGAGRSVIVPACVGHYRVYSGVSKTIVLRTFVPLR